MSELDLQSTDAMHWADQLVITAKENGFTLEQVLDESWLVGWFSSYWAAVHDPLAVEVERCHQTIKQQSEALEQLKEASVLRADTLKREGYFLGSDDAWKVAARRCVEIAEEPRPDNGAPDLDIAAAIRMEFSL